MNNYKPIFEIESKKIGGDHPTYFVADIAANHDGDLSKAKDLIYLAAESGANAAKFQHFSAETIVSDHGFKNLSTQQSHQKSWSKSVFEVYKDASVDLSWTQELKSTCDKAGIHFFTSPYSKKLVDHIDPYVPAYKIGSGDITWIEIIEYIAKKNKPYIIASGASSMDDVKRAVLAGLAINPNLCLMQCNTNYTASLDNFKFIQLNVLKLYKKMFPNLILGLSDHTPGHATVLGSIALGARMIEKHFTDNVNLDGPDHKFSMDPKTWSEMVKRTKELENSLGSGDKKIEDNEKETVVVQRRSVRLLKNLKAGSFISKQDLIMLRPCPEDAILPYQISDIEGREIRRDLKIGDYLRWIDLK